MTQLSPVIFGEVLYDCFPDGSVVLGGAPFNVAWHLQAFGVSPLLISCVGDDRLGQGIEDAMRVWGMDRSGLQHDPDHSTGSVDILFTDGEPGYSIVDSRAYDFIDFQSIPPLQQESLLYHGSLALRHSVSRKTLERLKQYLTGSVFVDVNLRSPWWSQDIIPDLLSGVDILKLNVYELKELVPHKDNHTDAAIELLGQFNARLLVVTKGDAGTDVYSSSGEINCYAPLKVSSVVDTVGAGDAFSSVMILGELLNWSVEDIIQRAQQFASAIVDVRGATIRDIGFYQQFCNDWKLK